MPSSSSRTFGAASCRVAAFGLIGAAAIVAVLSASPARAADTVSSSALLSTSTVASLDSSALFRPSAFRIGSGVLAMPASEAAGAGQVGASLKPVTFALRLGMLISPRWKFDGGADLTFNNLHIIPGLQTRVDADAIVSANFGGASTLVPLTLDQVYSHGLVSGSRVYFGGGVGPYIGNVTRFGAKVFVGADISSHLGGEIGLHFPGFGPALLTAQLRTPF